MLYSFEQEEGNFDIVEITEELCSFLQERDKEKEFISTYEDGKQPGVIEYLLRLGISPNGIVHNVNFYSDVPPDEMGSTEFTGEKTTLLS